MNLGHQKTTQKCSPALVPPCSAPTPALRISALHAAASLAGAERMHEGARSLAILSQDAELVLRESLYNACAGTSMHTPAEVR